MLDKVVSWLFDPSGLSPHGFCLLWEPGLIWLHALSDIGIGLAYFAIPFVLVAIIRQRPDLGFRPLFGLFAAFILFCGADHWLNLLTLWVPAYGVEGVAKALTALISITTATVLWRLLPQARAWPSAAQLREVNAKLLLVQQSESRMAWIVEEATNARDALARELSQRATMEQTVIESEERLRLVMQSSIAEAIYLIDADGNVETWNAGAERIKGYAPSEIVGRNFSIFFTPEDIAKGEPAHMLATARDSGRFTTDGVRVRKDGARFLARVSIDALHNHDGTLRGFVKVTADISGQRIEEEQRSILIEAAPNGMMIVDETGNIRLANTRIETIFGYPHGALVGQSIEALVPDNIRTAHAGLRSKFTSGQDVRAMATGREFVGRRQDGSDVSIEILLSPVKTARGRVVVASVFDVTERRRVQEEKLDVMMRERLAVEATNASLDQLSRHLTRARDRAEQANRAKTRFLAGMSHELRTPLNGIMGYAHLLHMEGGLNSIQEGRVNAMLNAGKHLLEMIACVLDLSEIESEHVTLQLVEVDLKAILAACLDLVRPTAEAKGLELSFAATQDTPLKLAVDPTRLRQVLVNLLGNAVKFTRRGRVGVQLRLLEDHSALRIEVEDTGPGIPAEQRDRLFKDFERLETGSNMNAEGAGLGLALSSRLAALMGGRLGHSNNAGGGSTFWLELPLNTVAMPSADEAPSSKALDEQDIQLTRLLHVLVADDVLMNRDIAASFLRAHGHEVTCVEGGAEAVAAAAGTDFDVILMDVRMPEMDGLEATRRIRGLEGARGQVPIVALTAQAFTDQVAECHRAGMDSHLAKPFDPDALLVAVVHAVSAGPRPGLNPSPLSMPTPGPTTSVDPTIGSELRNLDAEGFDRTAAFLTPQAIAAYIKTIDTMGESLLLGLRASDASAVHNETLVETVHKLAGSAGMFGFERVAGLSRRFEQAVRARMTNDVALLAGGLCMAIEAMRDEAVVKRACADAAA